MATVAAVLGLLLVVLGMVGLLSPSNLLAFVARWQSRGGLYVATLLRLALGGVLRWWSVLPPRYVRAWSTVVLALGTGIVWAVMA